MVQWAGVLYSDQNQITQNQKTKLGLEGTSGVIPPQVQDFSFAFVDVHSMSNLDLISTFGCTTCGQTAAEFLARSNSSSGFQPNLLSIYPVCILSICLWWTWSNSPAKVRTEHKPLSSHPPTLWMVTQCDSPHTHQCWGLTIIPPFVSLEKVSRRIFSITFLGIVVRLIPIGSGQFQPVLTGCNWIKRVQNSSNQFQLVPTSSNQFQPIQTGTEWFQPIQTNPETVGTGWNCPELVRTSLNRFELVRTSWNCLELVWTSFNWTEAI